MVTERHNIASRILLKGINNKGPLEAGLAPWTLAAQIVLLYRTCIPEHSTNRTFPKYIFPRRFPD
eukprot:912700-Pelagomonas_calceolata.AAC.1